MHHVDELERAAIERHEQRKRELQQQARELGGLAGAEQKAPQYIRRQALAGEVSRPDYCSCPKPEGSRGCSGGFHVRTNEVGTEEVYERCPQYAAAVQRNAANTTPKQKERQRQRSLVEE